MKIKQLKLNGTAFYPKVGVDSIVDAAGTKSAVDTVVTENSTNLITSGAVHNAVPTKTSDLTNDSNFVNQSQLSGKQDQLISGTNIKTINGNSLLGSGNIDTTIDIDDHLDDESENAIQNKPVAEAIGAIDVRVDALEDAIGDGGSIDGRILEAVGAAKSNIKGNATSACDTLGKAEALITAEAAAREDAVSTEATRAQSAEAALLNLYRSLSQSAIEVIDTLPQTGEANKIYRLIGTTSYSDYMYNADDLTTPILMATYNNAVDNVPTAGSDNLVKSSGVFNAFHTLEFYNTNAKTAKEIYDKINQYVKNVFIVPTSAQGFEFVKNNPLYILYMAVSDSSLGGASSVFGIQIRTRDNQNIATRYISSIPDLSQGNIVKVTDIEYQSSSWWQNFDIFIEFNDNIDFSTSTGLIDGYPFNIVSLNKTDLSLFAYFQKSKESVEQRLNAAFDAISDADDVPTVGSDNLIKSGGVFNAYSTFSTEDATEFAKVSPYLRNVFIIPKTTSAFNILKTEKIRIDYIGVLSSDFQSKPFAIQVTCTEGAKQVAIDIVPDLTKSLIYKLEQIYADSDFAREIDVYVEFNPSCDFTTTYFETVRNYGAIVNPLENTYLSLLKEILNKTNCDEEPVFGSANLAKSGGIYNMFTTFKSTSPEELAKVTQYLKNLYLIPKTPEDFNILKSVTDLRITYIGSGGSTWSNHPFGLQIAGTYNGEFVYINKHLTYRPELSKNTIVKLDYTDASTVGFLRNLTIYADFSEDADFVTEKDETIGGNGVFIRLDTSFVSLFKDIVKEELVYTITNNGDGDFLNLKECIDYINTLEGFPKVTIRVGNGTYNMRSWYTNEEWNAVGFQGLVIPRNVTIEGIGKKRSDVVINCIAEEPMSEVSALHLTDNATIKNLTVYASNVRYTVHDDESDYNFANENGSYRHIENCDFIADNTQRNFVYGAGTQGGANWYFKNCRFINKGAYTSESGVFSVHDRYDPNSETQSYRDEKYIFEDCEFIGHHQSDFRICPANGGVEETIILKRCKLKKVYVTSGYTGFSGSTTIFNVIGSANSKDIKWGYRAAAIPNQGVVYNERKTIPCFSDTTISGINCDTEAISVGDYCKYDEHYGIIKGTENDNIGKALLGANVGDVMYVSKDYEFTYIGL